MKETESYIKFILIKILYIIIIPIILYDLILIAQTIINPNITPNIFGVKTFNIVSGSMRPTINVNDIVIVKKIEETELNKNDIISFNIDNEVITHRIIDIEENGEKLIFTTKGDNNEVADIQKIQYNQIEGKYIGKIPKIGKILSLLKNKIVFTVILLILIAGYMYEKKKISNKVRRKEKRKKWERERNNGSI